MEYTHPETGHSVDEDTHEDSIDAGNEFANQLEDGNYPDEIKAPVKEAISKLSEYKIKDGKNSDDKEDESKSVDENEEDESPMSKITGFVKEKNSSNPKSMKSVPKATIIHIG